ncbi:MAG: oxidoreductase [Microbacteriaceae bacterium]|nr:oxidoreductase [Microbacteriaceae bacterium]
MIVKTWLDRLTGRVTMYRLMTIVLGAVSLIALVLSFIPGGLAFTPLQLLASLVVAVLVTALASRLFGLIFRAKTHTESSIISGLLIFLLFFPTTTVTNLLVIALVALIASASKFVLAIRGRHIFNPVAIAAVIIAFTQLSAAVWWVGTPYLLAPVIIGGFLVVYRTRRFALVGTFVLLALLISIARLSLGGADIGQAVWLSLASSPILFFACFMLDEPLTLPPLRWQQLLIAVIAAVVMEVPFNFWVFYSSPELGLVVGNIVAFLFGQRRSIPLDYVGARELAPGSHELTFAPARTVRFRPGQYMELTMHHGKADARGVRRVFSVASAPGDGAVAFGVRMPESGSSYKRAIATLAPGARVRATSVGGDFVLPRDTTVPLLLVAGGIGITPFISQLRHIAGSGEARDIVLVYSIRHAHDLAYAEELESFGIPVLLVAPAEPPHLPAGWHYLGPGRLDASMLADRVPRLTSRTAYVSGPPAMVDTLRRELRALGVRRVKADYFSGY